jgi:hypothetical protein
LDASSLRTKQGENALPQHIKVVDIAEQALQTLEVQTPRRLLLRQKTFDQVAKAFQRNTQMVSGLTAAAIAPPLFALASFGEAAQSEPGEMRFGGGNALGALGQAATPTLPALAGKARQSPAGAAPRVAALHLERTHEKSARPSLLETEAARPFFRDLGITQFGQALQQILAGLSQVTPLRVRVQIREAFGERAAAAQSNAQIVNRLDREAIHRERLFGSDAAQRTFKRTARKGKIC